MEGISREEALNISKSILENAEAERKDGYINFTDVSIWDSAKLTWTPCNSLVFGNGVGKLTWESGKCVFEGDAEESAKIFFNYVCSLIDTYNSRESGFKCSHQEK